MELSKLRELVSELRALGITKYKHEGTELELGEPERPALPVDIRTEGFVESNGRSAALNDLLKRLDPQYSDPSLFEIK